MTQQFQLLGVHPHENRMFAQKFVQGCLSSIIHKLSIGENSPNVCQLTHGQAMRSVHTVEDYLTTHRNEVLTLDNRGEPRKHVNQSQKTIYMKCLE